ncbi:hypothetical protein EB796_014831 [Bugula neritina]|uniref:Uncharacterized protein n=1 Tax=Bugula neritina TaxID=10212 RepID=A0A7J7JLE1_BUGNE|nr:hypothetical protein EB796_014831 [Bugula neritina]
MSIRNDRENGARTDAPVNTADQAVRKQSMPRNDHPLSAGERLQREIYKKWIVPIKLWTSRSNTSNEVKKNLAVDKIKRKCKKANIMHEICIDKRSQHYYT